MSPPDAGRHRLSDLAAALGARLEGDGSLWITGAAEPASAGPEDLALAMRPEYAEGLGQGGAQAALLWPGADWRALGLKAALVVPRPRYALAHLTRALDPGPDIAPGIHPSAVIDPTARIADGAAIGPLAVIGAGAIIGARARIGALVSIAAGAIIGDDALLSDGVRIGPRVRIGARFIAQPGAVVGGDGFSFVTPDRSAVEAVRGSLGDRGDTTGQGWTRIHSLGGVEIGDDVEIGANATIDAGTIRATRVGSGCKLDNLVHVGHNVMLGRDCMLCGQVGIAGSSRLGDRVVLAGQCGVNDNIFIGDDVIAGGASKIFTNVPSGRVVLGAPAVKMDTQIEINKALRRLPRLMPRLLRMLGAAPDAATDAATDAAADGHQTVSKPAEKD